MVIGALFAAAVVVVGLYLALVVPHERPASAPDGWTPAHRRGLGIGIALAGVILLVVFLVV